MAHHLEPPLISSPRRPLVPVHRPSPPPISLHQPRPCGERLDNVYIDTPPRVPPIDLGPPKRECPPVPIITHQPGLLKHKLPTSTAPDPCLKPPPPPPHGHQPSSIICSECGKCKCSECLEPKRLPDTWICNNKCRCSAKEIVEHVTCLCCVKGLFYHLWKDREEAQSCSDHPCSCAPPLRFQRWALVSGSSLVLPCLCLYLPCKMLVKVSEKTYAALSHTGCRCASTIKEEQHNRTVVTQQPERRKLLLSSLPTCC